VDTILFEIGERDDAVDRTVDAVVVFLNGRDLVDVLREVELPLATREGKPDLAGSYVGLPPEEIFLPSPRLLGEPATYYDYEYFDGKIYILGCRCLKMGCWPFRVKIELRDNEVVWSGFEQPHRAWRYDGLQPFVFDRTQYLSALDQKPDQDRRSSTAHLR
jgi:hypothetical protein